MIKLRWSHTHHFQRQSNIISWWQGSPPITTTTTTTTELPLLRCLSLWMSCIAIMKSTGEHSWFVTAATCRVGCGRGWGAHRSLTIRAKDLGGSGSWKFQTVILSVIRWQERSPGARKYHQHSDVYNFSRWLPEEQANGWNIQSGSPHMVHETSVVLSVELPRSNEKDGSPFFG